MGTGFKSNFSKKALKVALKTGEFFQLTLKDELGSGGQATVYKAIIDHSVTSDLSHYPKGPVALRVIGSVQRSGFFGDIMQHLDRHVGVINRWNLARVESEAEEEIEMVKQFSHKNILQHVILAPLRTETGEVALVVDLCKGSLDNSLTGDMDFSKILAFLADASEGLEYMHRKGFVHADVKPGNILISSDGSTGLLGDFGMTTKEGEEPKGYSKHYRLVDRDVNTQYADLHSMGLTAKDLVNLDWGLDPDNKAHAALLHDINEIIEDQLHLPSVKRSGYFAQKMSEFSTRAKALGCKPLGEKNLYRELCEAQDKRLRQ